MAKKKIKWATQKEYLKNTAACPACGSHDITGGSIEIEGGSAYQTVLCDFCGAKWADIYTLSSYMKLREPDGR